MEGLVAAYARLMFVDGAFYTSNDKFMLKMTIFYTTNDDFLLKVTIFYANK